MSNLTEIFIVVKNMLEKHSEGLTVKNSIIGSKAKLKKPTFHLYGSKEVSIIGKKPQLTYLAGVIQQKNYVSFYFSPVYSHPKDFQRINSELKAFLKGKNCFNFDKINENLLVELEKTLVEGIKKYEEIGWI